MSILRATLNHAVTRYDRRRAGRKGYNPNALGIYLGRVDEVVRRVTAGADLAATLDDCFNDRLLDVIRKACGIMVERS